MIVYDNLLQRSLEWHEIKWGKIGGTLSGGLLKPTDALFIDLISQIGEEFEPTDSYQSYDMIRGVDMEPYGLQYASEYTGINFTVPGWLECEEIPLLGISPDGLSEDHTIQLEMKCPARKKHWETIINNEIPLEHIAQCVHAFTVNPKLEKLYFLSFRPEAVKNFIKELTRDSMVDIGLKETYEVEVIGAKGKPIKPKTLTRPKLITISECVCMAKQNAINLQNRIDETLEKLKF